jgi:hypothetical protein
VRLELDEVGEEMQERCRAALDIDQAAPKRLAWRGSAGGSATTTPGVAEKFARAPRVTAPSETRDPAPDELDAGRADRSRLRLAEVMRSGPATSSS